MANKHINATPTPMSEKSFLESLEFIREHGYAAISEIDGELRSVPHYLQEQTLEGQAKKEEQIKELKNTIEMTFSKEYFSRPSKIEQNFPIFLLSLVGIVFVNFFVFAVLCKSNKTIKNKTTTLNNDKDSFSKEEIEKKEQEKKRLKEYLQDLEIQDLHKRIKDLESKLNQKN